MIIYNAMLKGLKAYRSDARLAYLAYHGTIDAPSVNPEEGIFLEFASTFVISAVALSIQ